MNNIEIYNAAVSGAAGGLNERWLASSNSADYAALGLQINAFATLVDAAVPAGSISSAEAKLMQSLCEGVTSGRYFGTNQTNDNVGIALSLAAVFAALRTYIQPEPSPGGLTSPVYIEEYLADNGNDFRLATLAAWAANPDADWFIYPAGDWEFVGAAIGPANGTRHTAQNTRVYRDMGGVASGQQIFFMRLETTAAHADRIQFDGFWKFDLLNCLTSYFGSAIYFESASNCTFKDLEFFCSLVPAATTGRIRWGLAVLGGTTTNGGGRNNLIDGVRTTLCQIQMCAQGRDVDGFICTNVESVSNNDFIVSCVSYPGTSVRNVTISNITGHNVGGGGCVFVGTDGTGTGIGADVVENILVTNINVDGAKDPVLDFITASIVIIDLGINSRNVVVDGVNTVLASTELQCRSVLIQSQDDEVSSVGVSVSNLNLGIVTTNDPLEALYIAGRNLNHVQITNVYVEGLRGVRIIDCDFVTCSNVNTKNGGFVVQAETRNLNVFTMSNSNVQRTTGFNSALQFSSAASRSFGVISLANVTVLDGSGNGGLSLSTGAAAGTTRITLTGCTWRTGTNQPNVATLAAIFRAVNCLGLTIISTVVVPVPAVLIGQVGYVAVAMAAGTRLADLVLNEAIVANPQAQIVAAGAGGGFVNARVSAAGTVEFAFLGPLAGGNVNFSVARAAA